MTSEWAQLPNAAHIDRVLASAKANPDHWDRAWATPAWDAPRAVAWAAAWKATRAPLQITRDRDAAYNAAREAVWGAGQAAECGVVWDALLALIAFDDCAYMLDSDPGELAILAKFGDHRAVLLLSACKAFHSIKEIV
jgi:hypothetical protein